MNFELDDLLNDTVFGISKSDIMLVLSELNLSDDSLNSSSSLIIRENKE